MAKKSQMPILVLLIVLGVLLTRKAVAQPTVKLHPTIVRRVLSYSDPIKKYARAEGVDPALVAAVMHQESGGRAHVYEPLKGPILSYGLMQVNFFTALDMGMPTVLLPTALFDPATNITYGTRYLKWLLNRYNGNLNSALSAYNQGPGNLAKYGITNWKYVNGVTALYGAYKKLF